MSKLGEVLDNVGMLVVVGVICTMLGAVFGLTAEQASIKDNCEQLHAFHIDKQAYSCSPQQRFDEVGK